MDALIQLRRLRAHAAWADEALMGALRAAPEAAGARRELAHVLGAEAIWLARLEERPAGVAIWPELDDDSLDALRGTVRRDFDAYLDRLDERGLDATVTYRNSAGTSFTNRVGDVLLHVAMHGQYHRGKVNAMLRAAGASPAPVDFIGFVRAAATVPTSG
jgi:uncharacterized damage-inducible protein DinB